MSASHKWVSAPSGAVVCEYCGTDRNYLRGECGCTAATLRTVYCEHEWTPTEGSYFCPKCDTITDTWGASIGGGKGAPSSAERWPRKQSRIERAARDYVARARNFDGYKADNIPFGFIDKLEFEADKFRALASSNGALLELIAAIEASDRADKEALHETTRAGADHG